MSYLRTSKRRREREREEQATLDAELEKLRASGRLLEVVIPWQAVGADPRDAADAFETDAE